MFFGSYEFHLDGKMIFGRFYDFDLKSSKQYFSNVSKHNVFSSFRALGGRHAPLRIAENELVCAISRKFENHFKKVSKS